jgi:hypothetical protein
MKRPFDLSFLFVYPEPDLVNIAFHQETVCVETKEELGELYLVVFNLRQPQVACQSST